ncbi:MAG: glycosyltransferase family 39 protein [Terriglobia bacterium]
MLARLDDLLKKYHALSSWLLILVAAIFFQKILTCGFVYDDVALILMNPYIKNAHLWRQVFLTPMWSFLGHEAQGTFYRPLGVFLFWLVCRVAGLNPAPYHLLQMILYSLGIWMVYRIGRELLPSEPAALAGALLWTLHPLHVEAVAWLSAIPDIACGLFCLLGFAMFLRAEGQSPPAFRHHVLAAAVFFPALFFKEFAFTFPLLILAYWFCFSSGESWLRRALDWLPYVGAAVICAVIRVTLMGRFSSTSLLRGFKPQVAWAAIGLLGEHAKLFFWPVNLTAGRAFDLSASLHSPWPWATLVILGLAVATRKHDPLLSFLVLWWLVLLLPCLDYRQLSFPFVEDQFSYLPSVGLCLALAYVAFVWAPRRFPKLHPTPVAVGAVAVVAALWAVQIVRTVPHWRDNDTMFDYALRVAPNSAPVRVSHGVVLQLRDNDLIGAAHEFQMALKLNAQSLRPITAVAYDSYIGLGQIALHQGREAEGIDYLNRATHLLPHFGFAYVVLGSVYFPRGDYARAAGYFRQAVSANPLDTNARFYLGTCMMKLAQPAQAAEQFRAAREVDPDYFQAYEAEARALEAVGDGAGAARVRRLEAGH